MTTVDYLGHGKVSLTAPPGRVFSSLRDLMKAERSTTSGRSTFRIAHPVRARSRSRWLFAHIWSVACYLVFGLIAPSPAAEPKPLLLLGDKDYPPITYLQDGKPAGLDVDLAMALSNWMARPVKVELMKWEVAQARVLAGEADGLLGMCITEERKALFDFADPAYTHEFGLFVRASPLEMSNAGDLSGKRIGATSGGLPRSLLSGKPGVNLVLIRNYKEGFEQLLRGTLDFVAADLWVGAYTIQTEHLSGITVVGTPFARLPSAVALRKGNQALVSEINLGLTALKNTGALSEIQDKWRPQEILFLPRGRVQRMLELGGIVLLLLLCAAMAVWIVTLTKQIRIRRATEVALHESEQRYKTLAENSPYGIAVSIDDKLVYINPAGAGILGAKSPEEIMAKSFWDFMPFLSDAAREEIRKRRKSMLETGGTSPMLGVKVRRLDGMVLEIEGSGAAISYAGRQAIQNTFSDVTLRKQMQSVLERQLDFEALINELLAGFSHATASELDEQIQLSLSAIGKFLQADYAFVDQIEPNRGTWSCTHEWCHQGMPSKMARFQNVPLGTSPWIESRLTAGEVVQINCLEDFPPEAAEERRGHSIEGIRSSLHVPLRGRGGFVKGCVGLLSISHEAVWGKDDVRWLKVLSDTIANGLERKAVEEDLRQSETRYRTLFESAQDAIFLMRDGRFTDCNLRTLQLFGCHQEDIIGQTPARFSPAKQPDGQPSDQKAVAKINAAMAGEAQCFEWRHCRLDRSEFDAEVSLNRLPLGRREMLLAIVRDITERKRIEEALRRQASFDEIIGGLLGGLASSSGTDIDDQVLSILKEIGIFIGVDIAFVLHINSELQTWSCTHEWCAPGIQGQPGRFQNVGIDPASWSIRQVWSGKLVNIRSLADMPPEAVSTRQRWEAAGYKAVIEVPLRTRGGGVYGCVGLLSYSREGPWEEADIRRLQMIGDAIANGLERKAARQRIEASREQLRALSSRLQSLREEERTRIAREIHDHLGQLLTALKLDLRSLERKVVEKMNVDDRTALTAKIASARELADEMIGSVQKIASELRPGILDRLGLAAAIESEAQVFQSRTGLPCTWTMPRMNLETTQELSTAVFRIFQEILTNVARHAQATKVDVRLLEQSDQLVLEVSDNGIGIKRGDIDNPRSLGLLGMQERAAILGGNVRFETSDGKGTTVVVQIPRRPPNQRNP